MCKTLLLQLMNRDIQETNKEIELLKALWNKVGTTEELISKVYTDIGNLHPNCLEWLRAIYAPRNNTVDSTYKKFHTLSRQKKQPICQMTAQLKTVMLWTTLLSSSNSLTSLGMPNTLTLKVGSPIMRLRNLKPLSFCNGTRLQVTKLMAMVTETTIITGTSSCLLYTSRCV